MNSQAIYVFAKWRIKEGYQETVLNLLSEVASKSTKETGNLMYKAHQSNADPNTILLYEGYRDEKAVAEHRSSEHFQKTGYRKNHSITRRKGGYPFQGINTG